MTLTSISDLFGAANTHFNLIHQGDREKLLQLTKSLLSHPADSTDEIMEVARSAASRWIGIDDTPPIPVWRYRY